MEAGDPLERRLAWVGEPLHHWPGWGDGTVTEGDVVCWGEGGLFTSLQLLWPPRSRDRHYPGPGWFRLATTPCAALHTVGGALVSVAGATVPAPGRKTQPGHLSPEAKGPEGGTGL